MRAGVVNQIKGPFPAGQNVFQSIFAQDGSDSARMKLGISIDEKDLLPFGDTTLYPTGFAFRISGAGDPVTVQMGRTGMYQTEEPLQVGSLVFLNEAPQSVIINFSIY